MDTTMLVQDIPGHEAKIRFQMQRNLSGGAKPVFGYTKPYSLDLTVRQNIHYKAHYCGLCFALSKYYGLPFRACTNFDSALLTLIISAQWPEPPLFREVFCPIGSHKKYYVIDSDELFMKLGSAFTVVMMDLKTQDSLEDGVRMARIPRFICGQAFARARSTLHENLFDTSSLINIQEYQKELESAAVGSKSRVSFDELAAPTGQGLAKVFEYTATLCGLPGNAKPLRQIGNAVGKMIYATDCLEDLKKDISKHRFNALETCSMVIPNPPTITAQAFEGLKYLSNRCQAEIAYALKQLELLRYRPIIENILLTSLGLYLSKFLTSQSAEASTSNHDRTGDIHENRAS